jgi:GTP-binding protein
VALNKADAMTPQARASRLKALSRAAGRPALLLSGATGEGVAEVVRALSAGVAAARRG